MKKQMGVSIAEKIGLLELLDSSGYLDQVVRAGGMIADSLKSGGKVMLAGNGGSAADAQHFAGEMTGRFLMERNPLPAVSFCVDPSVVTCISNDYGYDEVFSRQVRGIGRHGDIFVGLSTSGNSKNIIHAVEACKGMGIQTVCFLGKDGGQLACLCDCPLLVPSGSTPRIQEIHTFTVHLVCEYLEKVLFGENGYAG